MKNKNTSFGGVPATCGPNKKEIKARLKSQLEAKDMLEDLDANGHFSYEMAIQVRGMNLLQIQDTKQELKNLKKAKR